MKNKELLTDILSHTVAVVGLGISNRPLADFLLSRGARVTLRDRQERHAFGADADRWEAMGARLCLGDGYLEDLGEEIIFRPPGMRPDAPAFATALSHGSRLLSEMELFLQLTPATVIGITGSDGKTTTTTVTGRLLEEACRRTGRGRVYVGGNNGFPLLSHVEEMGEEDIAVVELSSFQLMDITRAPHRAAITNITPNHLNWHHGMEEYIRAKENILRGDTNCRAVLNAENAVTRALGERYARPVTWFSSQKHTPEAFAPGETDAAVYTRDGKICFLEGGREEVLLDVGDILLPGVHNLENYLTAIALTRGWVTAEDIRAVATTFSGVRHRLECVRTLDGVTYYNSSIDSSPTRTAAALSALPKKPIVICGGCAKGIPFEPLADTLVEGAKAVILTGETAEAIRQVLSVKEEVQNGSLPVMSEPDFEDAVKRARDTAIAGDIVLLSPACTSFDRFRNFEERGDTFCRIVRSF